ncbi:copper homeostasis membrane protein CopD [Novosphingobium cyanobacteriorum]|uniref:Copper homeostasis membrane protein CopD n=1 Tax=Novosphingobium cyanobacteriorum TaxID=3024215 RepID=A0ABT6CNK6_9SPHN|nr:copper homeostasis membrane protein CopD [Novosphingobium cyanobacteriorum]MDF8335481.1 copper homeostasis membrane protein CopD [Novosphingobium cyanobacteriorum]
MTDLPVIVIRFALYADLMVLTGLVAFTLYGQTAEERTSGMLPLTRLAIPLSFLGLLLSAFGMAALIASMTGTSLLAIDGETARSIIGETAIGTAWIVRMAAMFVALVFALMLDRGRLFARMGLLLCAALAIATLVWTGHAGATEGWQGTLHRSADVVHMLAAAVWIGGIAAFALLLFRPFALLTEAQLAMAARALAQFSQVGTLAVGLIVATGVANGLILLGWPDPARLIVSTYGQLLLAKLALFAAMLILAAINRWRLTPTLGAAAQADDAGAAVGALRRSLLVEGLAALAILALVAWLGTLEPLGTAV